MELQELSIQDDDDDDDDGSDVERRGGSDDEVNDAASDHSDNEPSYTGDDAQHDI
jgi:hypothetical protein